MFSSYWLDKVLSHLDLWHWHPKFNRGRLLVMTNHHTKLEDPRSMCLIIRQGFELQCHCDLDLSMLLLPLAKKMPLAIEFPGWWAKMENGVFWRFWKYQWNEKKRSPFCWLDSNNSFCKRILYLIIINVYQKSRKQLLFTPPAVKLLP